MNKIKIGLSMGDPNGVGLEIILTVFEDKALYKLITPILFAPKKHS
jgi:4-hydroxythreonine-4-phosphate dehydrogenase